MRHTIAIAAAGLVGAGALAWASSGHAQEESYFNRPVAAPTHAFELKVGTGYTQGFGWLTPTQHIADVAGPGIGVDVGVAYRADPRWSIGVECGAQDFQNNATVNTAARGVTANVGVTYHGSPYVHGDPWLRLGTGYRALWNVNPVAGGPTTMLHGFEIAKASVGYDVRVSPHVAIAPLVGADVGAFVWQEQNGGNTTMARPQLGTYVFAGLQGRFDFGPTTGTPTYAGR